MELGEWGRSCHHNWLFSPPSTDFPSFRFILLGWFFTKTVLETSIHCSRKKSHVQVVCLWVCIWCVCAGVWCVGMCSCVCMCVCVHVGACACEDQKTVSVAPLGTNQSCFCLSFQIESLTGQELFWLARLASQWAPGVYITTPYFSCWSWRSDAHASTASTSLSEASLQLMSADHYASKTPQHSDSFKHHFNKAEKPFEAGLIDSNADPFIILSNHSETAILGYLLDSEFMSFTKPQESLGCSGGLFDYGLTSHGLRD